MFTVTNRVIKTHRQVMFNTVILFVCSSEYKKVVVVARSRGDRPGTACSGEVEIAPNIDVE